MVIRGDMGRNNLQSREIRTGSATMGQRRGPIRGRGTTENPPNRFERLAIVADPENFDRTPLPRTEFLRDASRSIIAFNQSPDVGFEASINPYRGCEHGCAYCYARPTHEQLGFSAGFDFESRILVKLDAPELLRHELASLRWMPQPIAMSGVTDPYQPVERRLEITRRCLEVLTECRNPVMIVTKNHLITRDVDLLAELSRFDAAAVFVSIPTLDQALQRTLEPRTSPPARRLAAIETLSQAGIPTGVLVAPVIPALTDHEIPSILAAAAASGARHAGHVVLRLPHGVAGLFECWLDDHRPDRKQKVLGRIREVRSGRLNDPRFGSRMRGAGLFADEIESLFELGCRKAGISADSPALSVAAFRRPEDSQLSLWRRGG